MRKLRLILLFPCMLLLIAIAACTDDFDNFSNNPSHILKFSTDTVAFDTVLSTVTTPTSGLIVYNKNSKPLLISSISLAKGDQSSFHINVDGVVGRSFENVEVRAEDSIFIFVNARLNENNETVAVLHEDQLLFQTNGVQQKIVLRAFGQDAYLWKSKIIETSEILPNDKPYLILDSLEIKEGAILSLQEGTVFYMHQNAKVKVRGTLIAKGTRDRRIVFRGDRMDNDYMVNIPYDRIPGQWGGIRFYETSYNNELDYVYIRNGSYGLSFDASTIDQQKLKMNNTIVTNVKGTLISAVNCWIEGENSEFTNSKDNLLVLTGGKYRFVHCTMANYYPSVLQWGTSYNQTLYLSNEKVELSEDGKKVSYLPIPIQQADFVNCIIYSANNRAGINLAKDTVHNPATIYNYKFQNSLVLFDEKKSKANFENCVFNKDPKFLNVSLTNDKKKSIPFDFRIDSISSARHIADAIAAQRIPLDMNGVSRLADEGPDAGAYEYVKKKE